MLMLFCNRGKYYLGNDRLTLKDPQCFGELICLHLQVEISD